MNENVFSGKRVTKIFIALAVMVLCLAGIIPMGQKAEAAVLGDDYPEYWKSFDLDEKEDEWHFYNRECTSFVAWRLNSANGVKFTNQYGGVERWGFAKDWGDVAQGLGIRVDMTPAVGAVYWCRAYEHGALWTGHVAWVAEVDGDYVTIEEYNNSVKGGYENPPRKIPASQASGYIHIADITTSSTPETPPKPEIVVEITRENFPDDIFRDYVSKNFDRNKDGALDTDEIKSAGSISVSNMGILSLKGIEYFTYLEDLYCTNNKLTELDLNNCTSLQRLYCGQNQLITLNVSNLSYLTYLQCQDNKLVRLNVSNCISLQNLSCYKNHLRSLNVDNCTSLQTLYCYENQLESLDLSNCTYLQSIDCSENQLESLNINNCTSLQYLSCDENQLKSLDVGNHTYLENLYCRDNQLTSLNAANCTSLQTLICENSQLTSLDISNCTLLQHLDCDNNQLESIDFSGCKLLERVNCTYNKLTSIDVSGHTTLKSLDFMNNPLEMINARGCTSLISVNYTRKSIKSIDFSGCASLTVINCDDSELSELDVTGCTSLKRIDCDNTQLTSLDLSSCKSLETIFCRNNSQLKSLNLGGLTALNFVWCQNNKLESLNVDNCTSLATLKCDNNKLSVLDVSTCPNLETLHCDSNHLLMLDVSKCPKLNTLSCGYNYLTSLDLSQNTVAGDCYGCKFTITLTDGKYDLSNLKQYGFDSKNAYMWSGAKYDSKTDTLYDFTSNVIEYHYVTEIKNSNGVTYYFKLIVDDGSIDTPEGHTHKYGTEWISDDTYHWHECSCGEKSNTAKHKEDSGTIVKLPTYTTPGSKMYRCTVCKIVLRTEEIPVRTKMVSVKIACPVDVEFYTSDGKLAGSVINNVPDNILTDKVNVYTDGEIKYADLLADNKYTIKMKGTDTGVMTYVVRNMDTETDEIIEEQEFANVVLANDKKFLSYIIVSDGIATAVKTEDVKLYVVDENGTPEKEVQTDGTEIVIDNDNITTPDDSEISGTPNQPASSNNGGTAANGSAVPAGATITESITVTIENKITGKTSSVRGQRAGGSVTVKLGAENDGYYANVYTKDGEYICSTVIEKGTAKFTVPDDVKISIIIDNIAYGEDVSSASGVTADEAPGNSGYSAIFLLIPLAILLTRKNKRI